MKRTTLFSLSLALVAATGMTPLAQAQDAPPPPKHAEGGPRGGGGRFGPSLTPEERTQFEAAKAKAELDPAVVAAAQDRSDLRQRQQALLKKSLASDPAALKALEQMEKRRGDRGKGEKPDPALRAKVQAARKAARQDPEMKELQKKLMEANKNYQTAFRAAMISADPAIGSILDKMEEGRGDSGKRREGRGGRGKHGGHGGGEKAPDASTGGNAPGTFAPSGDQPGME